ncbi:MAG TPA: ROK family protein [Candidatus Eremiobacteraceae bacterium]|nr:ROK family protein [Candidatus Eremiobacteraceae bacterium]
MRVGVALGNTRIEAMALADDGSTLARERVPTPGGYYDKVLDAVKSLVDLVEQGSGKTGTVGISLPGAISAKTGRVKNSNSAYLIGTDLTADISQKLGREVRIGNDANCFALSEATDGAAAGARVVFGVILGTGVGAGLVIDRHIIEGVNAIAGEIGHNPLPWSNDDESARVRCYCGKIGCIEAFLSGPGLQRAYKLRSGRYVDTSEIARAATSQEGSAIEALAEYEDRLGRSLATVVNILDPDVIVLGGDLSNIEWNYRSLHEAVARYALTDRLDTKIVRALYGDSSDVRGAAMLWPT